MGKRRPTKSKPRKLSFKLGSSQNKSRNIFQRIESFTGALKVLAVAGIFVAVLALLYFAEKHIRSAKSMDAGPLVLVDVPGWVTGQLKAKIFAAAGGRAFRLNEQTAQLVAKNVASAGWIDEVKVQTAHDRVRVKGSWRKPLALVKSGFYKFYVDENMVVLDFVPLPEVPLVQVKGVSVLTEPPVGQPLEKHDLAAAISILSALARMDHMITPDKPLLTEIDCIDVSNFNGRQNSNAPHIILYAKDQTEIIWGAEFGSWQQHLEATDEEKLAKLYSYYKACGSLLGGAKYINLRNPQDRLPLPVDKY